MISPIELNDDPGPPQEFEWHLLAEQVGLSADPVPGTASVKPKVKAVPAKGGKNSKCPSCSRTCRNLSELIAHGRAHTGESRTSAPFARGGSPRRATSTGTRARTRAP